MDEAAKVVPLHYLLPLLAEDNFEDLMEVVRLFVVFVSPDGTF
jgi:hypothetical protein